MSTAADALPRERQQQILARLREQGRVIAATLASEFGVSEDSIRRDLRELSAQGLCRRVYGGALMPTPVFDPLLQRLQQHTDRKRLLARAAVQLIQPGQLLLMDASSTNVAIADALPQGLSLTVATNSPGIAHQLLGRGGITVLQIGGRIDPVIRAALGVQALEQLQRLRADLCFPGVCGIDCERGLWGIDIEDSAFKRAMIDVSNRVAIVATQEKVGALAAHAIAPVELLDDLVVEHDTPAASLAGFRDRGLSIHIA